MAEGEMVIFAPRMGRIGRCPCHESRPERPGAVARPITLSIRLTPPPARVRASAERPRPNAPVTAAVLSVVS
jgi:hypothetical protein